MLDLGTPVPHFRLPNVDGRLIADDEFLEARGLRVAFICNHCQFVKHIRGQFAQFAKNYQAHGLAVVAINSNDVQAAPDDSPEAMTRESAAAGFTFPYLYDESQRAAQEFSRRPHALFFLFDADRRFVYRGEFDDSRPGNTIPVTGTALRAAADAVLAGGSLHAEAEPRLRHQLEPRERAGLLQGLTTDREMNDDNPDVVMPVPDSVGKVAGQSR
jgi:thiol-disulfide isomerase/thioredoxin